MFFRNVATFAVAALLSTIGLNQIAQAKDLLIIQKIKKSIPHIAKKSLTKKISPVCVNFTGNWVGVCIDSDGEQYSSVTILEQDECENITWDGVYLNINGLNTIAESPSPNSEWPISVGGSISTKWNDAQTRMYRSVGFSVAGYFSGVSTQEMWLEGDSLRVKDTAGYFLDSTGVTLPDLFGMPDCTYTRR